VPDNDARLVQAYDQVFLLGGDDTRPLVWDGDASNDFVFADTKTPAASTPSGLTDSNSLIPGAVYFPNTRVGCYHKNRLWVKGTDPNQVYPSDILSPTDFFAVNEFYVNQGDSDEVRALVPYTNDRIIAFKGNSMYSLDNLTGDLSGAAINLISNSMGIVADRSAQVVGPNMIWLSRRGVMMAQLVQEQRLTPDTVPLSEPIDQIIRRINWIHADKAVGVVYNDRYMLAVPLDDNTQNSAVLVYNFKNQAWESIDIYEPVSFTDGQDSAYNEGFGPQTLNVITATGRNILLSTTHAGCLALYRYNFGKADRATEGTTDISAWLASYATGGATAATTELAPSGDAILMLQ